MKKCNSCDIEKHKSKFHLDKSSKGGYKASCKSCISNRMKTKGYMEKEKLRKEKYKDSGLLEKWHLQNEERNDIRKKIYETNLLNKINELKNSGIAKIKNTDSHYITPSGYVFKLASFPHFNKTGETTQEVNIHINFYGYKYVSIRAEERRIHQLVAESYLNHSRCGFKIVVDHIDNNKMNNDVSNLQLITHSQNLKKYWYQKNNNPELLKFLDGVKF